MAPPTKEEVGKLKVTELQKELEDRGLDVSGKKTELVDKLWSALESEMDLKSGDQTSLGEDKAGVKGNHMDEEKVSSPSVGLLLKKLKLIKEKHAIEDEKVRIRARAEQEELRLKARSEQLALEMELAERGHTDEGELDPLRVVSDGGAQGSSSSGGDRGSTAQLGVLSAQVKRSLLPPTDLRPFSGEIGDFRLFMRAFEARIETKTTDQNELLFYLDQFTKGKPNQLVRGCLHLGEAGFAEARRLLEARYGDNIRLVDSYLEKVRGWPRVATGDVEALDQFVLFLTEVMNAMSTVTLGEFDHPSNLRLVVSKLPSYLQDRWMREADRLIQGGGAILFSNLVGFLSAEVRVRRSPLFGSRVMESGRREDGGRSANFKVNATQVTQPGMRARRCYHCGGGHGLDRCQRMLQRPWSERRRILLRAGLCFGCLGEGHRARSCDKPLTCEVCGGRHPSVMHREPNAAARGVAGALPLAIPPPVAWQGAGVGEPRAGAMVAPSRGGEVAPPGGGAGFVSRGSGRGPSRGGEVAPPRGGAGSGSRGGVGAPPSGGAIVSASLGLRGVDRTALPVVAIRLRGPSGREVITNGFLDPGSSGSFLTDHLAASLEVQTETTSVTLETVGSGKRRFPTSIARGVHVADVSGGAFHALPALLTVPSLPVTQEDRCQSSELRSADHLRDVELAELDAPVGILIGSNCAELLVAREVRSPPEGQGGLCAVRTVLGWHVMGRVPGTVGSGERLTVNFLRVQSAADSNDDVTMQTSDQCTEGCQFRAMYERDFGDLSDDRESFSVEEREWLADVRSGTRRDPEGHFEIPLPKVDFQELPDSFGMAARRLNSLRNRFRSDPEYFDEYRRVIGSLADDGYAVPVSERDVTGPVWYMPHHGVREPSKDKLRVVFDCAARSHGVCLNDLLRKGPVLTNSLLGVLCRFREGPVAFTCDIQSMYHRVRVPEADTNLLRFLWFRDDNPDGELQVWKMRCHVFGAVSSSSVSSFALSRCAEEGRSRYPEAADILLRKTYVDDALCAVESVDTAVRLTRDLKELCATGAFNMTKFTSGSSQVLKQVPVEDRGKNVKRLDLDKDRLSAESALGLKWSVEKDAFCFQFKDKQRPLTRRGVLSTVSSVFDPLGVVSPVTLLGRVLLQKMCALSCAWDDALPETLAAEWQEWLDKARELDLVQLDRCIVGPPGEVRTTQLHVFADASETAYSAVAYLRREVCTPEGQTVRFVSFLIGKSLVNPVKFVSVPRLELAAAVLAGRVRKVLERELDTSFDSVHMWTDSMVVLSCIRNRTTRFKTYVANRLAYIHDGTEVAEWSHVPTDANPADVGSRGSSPAGLDPWLGGPEFLHEDADCWPVEPAVQSAVPACEVRSVPVAMTAIETDHESPWDLLIHHFSSYFRLKRAVAWYRRFLQVLRSGAFRRWCMARRRGLRRRERSVETSLTLTDLRVAERAILRHVQKGLLEFPGDLCDDGPVDVKRGSPLAKLRPEMRDGLLVVGGRLGRSDCLSVIAKHPVILPRKHHVTRLVIREAHAEVGHGGRDHTFWRLRERFWVLGAGPEIRKLIRSCVICRKVNARPQQQLMADLPVERVSGDTPAFSSVLLDVFGPILVKTGRVEKKRYGLMCVCVVTRGVHIEVLDSLRTDSLINAVRRISARRGQIHQVRSDMGTNMTGADRELREALRELNTRELQRTALERGIDWRFNPPTASHFAGGVERQIRTFRKIWRSMPLQQRVDDESLRTLFCEIESIMNSRPLTYISTSCGEVEPLTPGHLLFLRGSPGPIPGHFREADSLSRRRWRQVQYLAQQFWIRWRREYLLSLQSRQKWTRESRNLAPGDVVLLVDENVQRGQWQMGRIERVLPSLDGLIRKAEVRSGGSLYLRPIAKMVLIRSECDLE